MKITILAVGRRRGVLAPAIREYEVRAARYWKLEVIELEAGVARGTADEERVRGAEAARIRKRLPASGEIWALTREGKGLSSAELARTLGARALRSHPGITFLVGGAFGLSSELLDGAARKVSLSRMTLPHGIARLLLVEQLYRAGTILRSEPYHKGRE